MPTPQFTDGRLHETEILPRAMPSYPFSTRQVPDIIAKQYDRPYLVDPRRYVPKVASRRGYSNIFSYSNNFANAYWSKSLLTVVSSVLANPWDGKVTVDKWVESGGVGGHGLSVGITFANAQYCLSGIFKAGIRDSVYLTGVDVSTAFAGVFFDLVAGRVWGSSGALLNSSGMIPLEGGFYLCYLLFTPAAGVGYVGGYCATAGNVGHAAGGDIYCAQLQMEAASMPAALVLTGSSSRVVAVPPVDPRDIFAFQFTEGRPEDAGGDMWKVMRTFARLPADQVSSDKRTFNRPVMNGIKSGTAYAVTFDGGDTSTIFDPRKIVASVTSLAAHSGPAPLPASTIYFQDSGGHTCTIPANSGAAAAQAALAAALTSLSGITVSTSYGVITIDWTGTMIAVLEPAGTNIVGGSSGPVTITSTGTVDYPAQLSMQLVAHGATVGDKLALWNGDTLLGIGAVGTIIDADNFYLIFEGLDEANFNVTHCGIASQATVRYVNGPKSCDIKVTERAWLPGYSLLADGSTLQDGFGIPGIVNYSDPIGWLAAIVSNLVFAAIDDPSTTNDLGARIIQRIEEVQMSDALETRSVSA